MHTLRQTSGLAGFTKRSESEYDPFGAGHSSTTISAGLGNCTVLTLSCLHLNSMQRKGTTFLSPNNVQDTLVTDG